MSAYNNISRRIAAGAFLIAPFLAYPLAFLRLNGSRVALYGMVQTVTLSVMSLLSLAIIAAFPEKLKAVLSNAKYRWLTAAAVIFVMLNMQHWQLGNIPAENFLSSLSLIAIPLAAAALADELQKFLPFFAAGAAILLIFSGCMSENFTGLAGNWNWLWGMTAALLPAAVLIFPAKWRTVLTLAGLTILFTWLWFADCEKFPRSALLASFGAMAVIFIRQRMTEKSFSKLMLVSLVAVIGGFFTFLAVMEIVDTRFAIWQGAQRLFSSKPVFGCGFGQFAEHIRQHLGENYFFSDFPAPQIDHAHNDLLNLLCENGIFGGAFYLVSIFTILRRREKVPIRLAVQQIFLTMLFCGFFDQHNLTVTGLFLLTFSAGILLAPRHQNPVPFPCPKRRFALAALILIWGIYLAAVNSCSSWFARQGALKLFEYDINGAVADFKRSNNIKVSAYCLYQLAELHLADGKPEQTIIYLDELERHCQLHNYLHAQRLRAVAAYQLGDMQLAAIALQRELLNAPFSVISADFQRYLLRAVHAEPSVIDAAEKNFAELCRMRQITPDEVRAPDFITIDDGPFPAEARGVK